MVKEVLTALSKEQIKHHHFRHLLKSQAVTSLQGILVVYVIKEIIYFNKHHAK